MFIAVYWWRVHPGKEDQFRAAWRRGTELIRERYGSYGSRLHRDAVCETPDGPDPLFMMQVTDDLLTRSED